MADIKSVEERSKNMSAIKNKDTKPEIYFRRLLFSKGYRYRKNVSIVPGHPDIYLARYNTAIFVNGCFWHRHAGCKYAYIPKSRVDFWNRKFESNKRRDLTVAQELTDQGIKRLVVWECAIKRMQCDESYKDEVLCFIDRFLSNPGNINAEIGGNTIVTEEVSDFKSLYRL